MRKFLIPALMAGAMIAAAPASAQSWFTQRGPANAQFQIRGEIQQLDQQISRAQQRRAISQREAQSLRRQIIQLQRNLNAYARNGLDRRETAMLNNQLDQVRRGLRMERRDNDRRRG